MLGKCTPVPVYLKQHHCTPWTHHGESRSVLMRGQICSDIYTWPGDTVYESCLKGSRGTTSLVNHTSPDQEP
jgi:hypothetical protein